MDIAMYGPREKLSEAGKESLNDAELLAILLGTGTTGRPAPELAQGVLASVGGIAGLARMGLAELAEHRGVGLGKAARITAALELGRRAAARPLLRGSRLSSSEDVYRSFGPLLGHLVHEELWAIALDARSRVIGRTLLSRGGVDACPIRPADVFRPVLREAASALILVHNHPSGAVEPSHDDLVLTERIAQAGELLGVRLLDHVIVSAESYFSCLDAGLHGAAPPQRSGGRS